MNKKAISLNLGQKFRLRPNPIVRKTGKSIKEDLNSWTFLAFPEEKNLIFQHNHSDYRIQVDSVYIRGHEPPDMIVLRGQFYLEDDLKFVFEPFTEGMSSTDPRELIDDPSGKRSPKLYDALKPHEGKQISIRFPNEGDGTEYGRVEAILQEVTYHYVKLNVPELVICLPDWLNLIDKKSIGTPPLPAGDTIPANKHRIASAYEKSIAIGFLQLEEDVEKKRPMLVIEHSNWETRL